MAAKSLIGTGVLYTDRRDFYISPSVVKELWTDVTPFTTIAANRGIITGIPDPLFKMFEHRDPWIKQQFTITGGDGTIPDSDAGLASVTIGSVIGLAAAYDDSYIGLEVEVWDATLTTKKGVAVISACPSNTSLTLKLLSSVANGGATIALVTGDICRVIGNAQAEGSTAPEAWADELKVVWGQTQMFETPIEITGTLLAAALRGYSSELERLRLQKNKEHKMQKEHALLFGSSVLGTNLNGSGTFSDTQRTVGSKALRTTMGIVTAVEMYGDSSPTSDDQNIFSITEASYTWNNFVEDMEKVFHYFPETGEKYALAGPGAISFWNKIGAEGFAGNSGWKFRLSEATRDSLGFNIKRLETPHGVLNLIYTPAFRGPRNKWMLVLSDENLKLVQYQAPKFMTNVKTENAYKGVKDVYFSDEGVGLTLIESHKLFKIV